MSYLLSQVQNHSNFLHFYVLMGFSSSSFYTLINLLGVFHYFGHHGRPASQIFNPLLTFDHFNPAIILIFKKCAFRILRYGLGPKQARLVILGTYISRSGTKICPSMLIFHIRIEKKFTTTISCL